MTLPVPGRPLLLLDYDGTLAPLVDDPAAARPHPDVPGLLAALAAQMPVYVLTGRDLGTLATLLTGPDGAPLPVRAIGLHGAEEGVLGQAATRPAYERCAHALQTARASVPLLPGVRIEAKGGDAFAVHYRGAPDGATVESALDAWAAAAPDVLEAVRGKCVIELRPRGVSKGAAARRLAAAHPGCTPVCLGDDVTDEHAFEALADVPDAVTVRVGPGETAARHRLPDVEAAVGYLRRVLTAQTPSGAAAEDVHARIG